MIRSMINRQRFSFNQNSIVKRTAKSREQIGEAVHEVIRPFRLQMKTRHMLFEFVNLMADDSGGR